MKLIITLLILTFVTDSSVYENDKNTIIDPASESISAKSCIDFLTENNLGSIENSNNSGMYLEIHFNVFADPPIYCENHCPSVALFCCKVSIVRNPYPGVE